MKWLVGRWWFWALAIGSLFAMPLVRVLMRPPPSLPGVRGHAPDFSLIRQGGEGDAGLPFAGHDLGGQVWVASRFDAADASAAMRAMHTLERRMRKLGNAFMLVSVVVDPARDTPATITAWGREHKTNPRRWALLTGSLDALKQTRHDLGLDPSRYAVDPLVLVDGQGRIRGVYEPRPEDPTALDQLVYDAGLLVNAY